ncbi:MAG: hypothetical protein WAK48_19185, partial [Candidatus Acidiferrum sp.]
GGVGGVDAPAGRRLGGVVGGEFGERSGVWGGVLVTAGGVFYWRQVFPEAGIAERFIAQKPCDGPDFLVARTAFGMTDFFCGLFLPVGYVD